MFEYFDAHSHLNLSPLRDQQEEIIKKMNELGVGTVTVGTDLETSKLAVEIAENNSTNNQQNKMELKTEILTAGTGNQTVKSGDSITVDYTGTLEDGTKFDSSIDTGKPFTFTIGQGTVIQGWDQGLIGMKIGEERKLTIPSDMAYGANGSGLIPPNATLIFTVKLISINPEN